MAKHMISVCIFCFICATHSPCASHASIVEEQLFRNKDTVSDYRNILQPERAKSYSSANELGSAIRKGKRHWIDKRNSDISDSDDADSDTGLDFIKKLFELYGDGEVISIQGFHLLVKHLNSQRKSPQEDLLQSEVAVDRLADMTVERNETEIVNNNTCITEERLTAVVESKLTDYVINQTLFKEICPIILYSLVTERCPTKIQDNTFEIKDVPFTNPMAWVCSMGAVILISGCGILALAIIPVMQKKFYKPLIQFLVALAVGTLAGDALLHLLPHAMTPHHHHHTNQEHNEDHSSHDENTMKGCVAMLGLTFFFIMEKLIVFAGKWRKGRKRHGHSHVTVLNDRRESLNQKNNTQCMDKYNPFPYCYNDITNNPNSTLFESDRTATTMLDPSSNLDVHSCRKSRSPTIEKLEANQNILDSSGGIDLGATPDSKMLTPEHKHDEDYTVILREHRNDHHGHSHKHGHVHAAPQNLSSVAWMVIMGDGLHNFTDGMAIGAAFSGGLAGGFSTTVAVFCHELPHELGDFAMLLKAGMTIKQALFYNMLSSVLCIFGNIFGLVLGNTEYASSWLFAAAAGMFIYIALVDMIPELSSAHEDEGNLIQCVLHLGGLLLGFAIMAVIALYEHQLKNLFNDPE